MLQEALPSARIANDCQCCKQCFSALLRPPGPRPPSLAFQSPDMARTPSSLALTPSLRPYHTRRAPSSSGRYSLELTAIVHKYCSTLPDGDADKTECDYATDRWEGKRHLVEKVITATCHSPQGSTATWH